MTTIEQIQAREILDSRGFPTVEVEVQLSGGVRGRAAVPSGEVDRRARGAGAARRRPEPLPRQGRAEGDREHPRQDRPRDPRDSTPPIRSALDRILCELDGTPNKSKLGANAILAVSMAARAAWPRRSACRCTATSAGVRARTLPVPMMNVAERRPACRQQPRHPGVHDRPGRGGELRRGAADGLRGLPRAGKDS